MDIRQFVSDHDIRGPLAVRIMTTKNPTSFTSFSAGYRWQPGWNVAHCLFGFEHRTFEIIPVVRCSCGFYGATGGPIYDDVSSWRTLKRNALVLVEAGGKVVIHEDGLRSARMRVVAAVGLTLGERFNHWSIGYRVDGWKWARDYFGVPLISARYIKPLIAYQMDRV